MSQFGDPMYAVGPAMYRERERELNLQAEYRRRAAREVAPREAPRRAWFDAIAALIRTGRTPRRPALGEAR